MIYLGYGQNNSEVMTIRNGIVNAAAFYLDTVPCDGTVTVNALDYLNNLANADMLDVCCIGLTEHMGTILAEKTRSAFEQVLTLLIVDAQMSPISYIRPNILASSLLIRPFSLQQAQNVFLELFRFYMSSCLKDSCDDVFIIENKQVVTRIPYSTIECMEAREKKVFIRTKKKEISFYSTLEKLEQTLPRYFCRCHKGFIVNTHLISRIVWANNLIYLSDSTIVPIGRSYKSRLREDVK